MSFRLKTIVGIALIEIVLLLVLITSALNFIEDSNQQALVDNAWSTARLFGNATKDAIITNDLATLDSFIDEVMKNPDVVYAAILSEGFVLASGGEEHDHLVDPSSEPPGGSGFLENHGVFDVHYDVTEGGFTYATIEMGLSTSKLNRLLAEAKQWIVGIALVEVFLVAIFSYVLGTYLTQQLHRLKKASVEIVTQGPGHQMDVIGKDEIADVAHAFNKMSLGLSRSYDDLAAALKTQKDSVAEAERARAKNAAILASSIDALITIDEDGKILDFNHTAESTFGWTSEEIKGKPLADYLVPPELRDMHNAGMAHYKATGEGPVLGKLMELPALHKEGHTIPVEMSINPVQTHEGTLFTSFIRDISDRKASETELRLAAQAFNTADAMFITDDRTNVIRVNDAFTEITGYSRDEFLGKRPFILASGLHDKAFYRAMWKSLHTTGNWSGEIYNKRKNGEIYPEYLSITAVRNNEGETTHYIAHFVDMTEQKKNERALEQSQRAAQAANEAKGRFLATMSHEIRTPMNGVLGILDLLRNSKLNSKQKQLVKTGLESGELLLNIINDILDYSKMEAGKLDLNPEPANLHRLFIHAVELLKPQADSKNLALHLDMAADFPQYGVADASRVRQVLLNLIGNAIKFTPTGHVTVRVAAEPLTDEQFTLQCEVEDTGIGIPEEHQASLFDEFTMADQTHSRSYEGSGLGLAICKQLVELMDGSITFTSTPGEGSTFRFSAIVGNHDAAPDGTGSADEGVMLRPSEDTRVLLAEDNPANQAVIRSILEHAGLDVDIVANGRQAVEAVSNTTYDIILMDISMPEMDGMEATREIRKLPGRASGTPIIALTAHSLAGDRERFLDAGMNDYLTKPVALDSTLQAIARWTGGTPVDTSEASVETTETATDVASDEAYVDNKVLQQLVHDTSPEVVTELVRLYIDDSRQRVAHITQALQQHDAKTLEFEVHTLGSSAAAHGNMRLHVLSRQIERLCKDGLCDQAIEASDALESIATESFRLLEERLAEGFA